MNRLHLSLLLFILACLPYSTTGQSHHADSLTWKRQVNSIESMIQNDSLDHAKNRLEDLQKKFTFEANPEKKTVIYQLLARTYQSASVLDSAVFYLEKASNLSQKTNPGQQGNPFLTSLAFYYWEMGNYSQALRNAQKAERYLQAHPDSAAQLRLNNIFGLIYKDLGNTRRAEDHFFKAINLAGNLDRELYKGVVWANMGSMYQQTGEYEKAIDYYEKGRRIELKHENYRAAGRSYAVLGKLYTQLGQYQKADQNLEEAKTYNAKANDLLGLARTSNARGDLFLKTGKYHQARQFYMKAKEIADANSAQKELMTSYQGLYRTSGKLGHYKKAFQYQSRYLSLYRELYSINEIVQLENLQHKLNMEQEKNRNQQQQIQKQNTINTLLLAIAILSAMLTALFIFLSIRLRRSKDSLQQKNKEILGQKEKLQKLNQNLVLAKKKAEESEKLKDQFLRNISHEIRTPLNGIVGFSSIIAEGEIQKEQRLEYYTFIKRNANLLMSTIDDILDIARIKTQQVELYNETFHLRELAEELKKMFKLDKVQYRKDNVEILIDSESISPELTLFSDPSKIRKTLIILMDNALKFTNKGFVKAGFEPNGKEIQFYVQDTGIGISENHQSLIYESFRQAETDLNRQFDGMGAGLSIAKSFVEMLKGRIWFESIPGQGTTFYFTIPRKVMS
jgi:signal transduction histidine kinase/Flp pilus assembly protein TadD